MTTLRRFVILCLFVAAAPFCFAQSADMGASKTGPDQAGDDTDVTYTITVTNFGSDDAANASFNDPLPGGMTFVSVTQDNGTPFTCTAPSPGSGGTVACSTALLANGGSATFTVVAHITQGSTPGTFFVNTVTVSAETFDPNDENNSATAVTQTPPPPSADLGVTKVGPASAGPGTQVVYNIEVTNSGPDAATTVSLTDVLPGTMTFVSLMQTSGTPFSCTDPGAGNNGTITCTIASLPVGTSDFTLTTAIPGGTPSGTTFTNVASIQSDADDDSENDQAQTGLTVSAADLSVTKTGPATVLAGQTAVYTITASNAGPDPATTVVLNDDLPAGTTFVSLVQDTGTPALCSAPAVGMNGTVTCATGQLNSGASQQFTLTVQVGNVTAVSNTATIDAGTFDPATGNNSATSTASVTPVSDLSITKTGPSSVIAGQNITYAVTAHNAGISDAPATSITDAIPIGTTFVSATQTSGGTAFSCSNVAGTITCTAGLFAAGDTAVFAFVVAADNTLANGTTISNSAAISSTATDMNPGNNTSSTVSTTAQGLADLTITKSVSPTTLPGDGVLTYTIVTTNNGPGGATGVTVTDVLQAGVTATSSSTTVGTCSGSTTVTCNVGALASGQSATITIQVQVPDGQTTVSNTATVTANEVDPSPGNNSGTAVIGQGTADLALTKSTSSSSIPPSGVVTYTIVATNNGPDPATNVVVTDPLPTGMTATSSSSTAGTCSGTTTVICSVGTLANGATATITIVAQVAAGHTGTIVNTAAVTATEIDPSPGNNTATASVLVGNPSDIPALGPLGLAMLAMALAVAGILMRRQ